MTVAPISTFRNGQESERELRARAMVIARTYTDYMARLERGSLADEEIPRIIIFSDDDTRRQVIARYVSITLPADLAEVTAYPLERLTAFPANERPRPADFVVIEQPPGKTLDLRVKHYWAQAGFLGVFDNQSSRILRNLHASRGRGFYQQGRPGTADIVDTVARQIRPNWSGQDPPFAR